MNRGCAFIVTRKGVQVPCGDKDTAKYLRSACFDPDDFEVYICKDHIKEYREDDEIDVDEYKCLEVGLIEGKICIHCGSKGSLKEFGDANVKLGLNQVTVEVVCDVCGANLERLYSVQYLHTKVS